MSSGYTKVGIVKDVVLLSIVLFILFIVFPRKPPQIPLTPAPKDEEYSSGFQKIVLPFPHTQNPPCKQGPEIPRCEREKSAKVYKDSNPEKKNSGYIDRIFKFGLPILYIFDIRSSPKDIYNSVCAVFKTLKRFLFNNFIVLFDSELFFSQMKIVLTLVVWICFSIVIIEWARKILKNYMDNGTWVIPDLYSDIYAYLKGYWNKKKQKKKEDAVDDIDNRNAPLFTRIHEKLQSFRYFLEDFAKKILQYAVVLRKTIVDFIAIPKVEILKKYTVKIIKAVMNNLSTHKFMYISILVLLYMAFLLAVFLILAYYLSISIFYIYEFLSANYIERNISDVCPLDPNHAAMFSYPFSPRNALNSSLS